MNAQMSPPARDILRAAITARNDAAARVLLAAAALDRAHRAASAAQVRFYETGNPDAEILAHAMAQYRAYAEAGGPPPSADVPPALAERQRQRDVARHEMAAADAARAELAGAHAAALNEHAHREKAVATAADTVVAEQAVLALGRYGQAIRQARAAWDDASAIAVMTVSTGPTWAQRARMPSLPPGLVDAINRGFGNVEPQDRSAAWEDLRPRLRGNADVV
jgi:hypothetical protein